MLTLDFSPNKTHTVIIMLILQPFSSGRVDIAYSAAFSKAAKATLVHPNQNEALSVDARQDTLGTRARHGRVGRVGRVGRDGMQKVERFRRVSM